MYCLVRLGRMEGNIVALTVKVQDAQTGKLVDGRAVRIEKAEEPFTHITLEDGTEITMRMTVIQVIRHVDQWDDDGNPRYTINASSTTTITSPEELKRQQQG